MVKTALYVRLEAKPGKEQQVEDFLKAGLPIVNEEPATIAWFGLRLGPSTFGIFDAFPSQPPSIEKVDVLASKLPA